MDPCSQAGRLTLTSFVWPDQVERLERLRASTTTVVFHSIVMQYLSAEEGERFERAVTSGGVAWLRMEVAGEMGDVRLALGGEDRLLARAGYHGTSIERVE